MAAIPIGVVEAVARMKDDLTPALRRIDKGILQASKGAQAAGRRMQDWGRSASVASGLVAGGVTAAGVAFGRFDTAMNRVEALTGATTDQMKALTDQAKHLGSTTVFSAKQAADGMGFLSAAGFKTNDILSAMPGLLNVAAAGQLELGRAADITSNVLSGFGLAVGDVGRVGDVLALTAASANTNITLMGESMTYVAPSAKLAGQSIEDMAAMIGQLGNAGIQGSMAGTSLNNVIIGLQKPTETAARVLSDLNISVFDVAGNMRPLNSIMRDLRDAGISNTQMLDLFNVRALKAAGILIDNVDATDAFANELRNAEGAAAKMAATMNKGLGGAFNAFKSASEGVLIALGQQLEPLLTAVLNTLTRLAQWVTQSVVPAFAALPNPVKAAALGVTALAVALGPLAIAGGTAITAMGGTAAALAALGPVFLSTSGLARSSMDTVRLVSMYAADGVRAGGGIIKSTLAALAIAFPTMARAARIAWAAMTGPIGLTVAGITALGAVLYHFREQVGDVLGVVILMVADWADRMLQGFEAAFGWIPGLSGKLDGAREAVRAFALDLSETVRGWGEKADAAEQATVAVAGFVPPVQAATAAVADFAVPAQAAADATRDFATVSADVAAGITGHLVPAFNGARAVTPLLAEDLARVEAQARVLPTTFDKIRMALTSFFDGDMWKRNIGDIFASFVTGAGDAGDKAGRMLGNLMSTALNAIPVAGPFLQSFAGPLVNGVKSLAGKVGGFFKGIFGGGKKDAEEMIEATRIAAEEAARLAEEAMVKARESAAAAAAEYQTFTDGIISNIRSLWEQTKADSQAAYAEAYQAAIDFGFTAAEAAQIAAAKQVEYIRQVMKAEGEKHAQLAFFEAALAEIRAGNAEGAAEAGRRAAEQTRAAWALSTEYMIEADALMRAEFGETQAANAAAAEAAAASTEASYGGITSAAQASAAASSAAAAQTAAALDGVAGSADSAASSVSGISGALNSIPSHVTSLVEITTIESVTRKVSEVIEASGLDPDDPDSGLTLSFASGSGGIRDFGERGTPAVLHGREAVMTQDNIERLIAAAAKGGGNSGGSDQPIIIQLGNRQIAQYMLSELRDGAQGRGY